MSIPAWLHFVWLVQQTWEMLFCYPPFAAVTFILLIGVVASVVRQSLLAWSSLRDRAWLVFVPFLIPWLILLVGTDWRESSPTHPVAWPVLLILALLCGNMLFGAFLVYFLPRSRLFVICMFHFAAWLSLWTSFVALTSVMSITEDWVQSIPHRMLGY